VRILIAEDEARISGFMERGLRAAGMTPTVVEDGITALDYGTSDQFDLMILDAGLPRMDGFTVLRTLRDLGATIPVIMVTARSGVEDTVQGLELGANDYIAKPFRFEELLARIRIRAAEAHPPAAAPTGALTVGDIVLDLVTRTVTTTEQDGTSRTEELSPREFAMARTFLENPDQVLTRDQLLSKVWGYDYDGASNVVDVYVRYLRTKIGPARIATVRGVGYRLAAG
jgi:DNA-binding response OmpR family regulator